MADAWGVSWGNPSAWGVSWAAGEPPPPVVVVPPPDAGGVGKLVRSARASRGRGGGGGNFSAAWRRDFGEKYDELADRLVEEKLSREKRKKAQRALEGVRRTVERISVERPSYYSENLSEALGFALGATSPRELLKRTIAARAAAEQALAAALAAIPQRYVMTDDDIAAILLLS